MQNHRLWMNLARTIVLTAWGLSMLQAANAADPLRYRPQSKSFAYEVTITADLPSEIQTLKGTIWYEVTSAEEPMKLKYQGGLSKSVKAKASSVAGRHGFGLPPIPFPRGPFGRFNSFRGIGHTTNELTVTSRGEVRSMEGSSQLPFLIGNLSLLVFEPLPEKDDKSWTVNTGVSVTESSGSPRRMSLIFGDRPEKTTAGSESTSFSHLGTKGDLATFKKTYALDVPDDQEKTTITGSGSWTFNRRLGVSESLDLAYRMVAKDEHITATIPLTINYKRLSAEQWAEFEKQRQEKLERAREDGARRLAERKAPIADDERQQILADLKLTSIAHLNIALMKLAGKEARSDEELARAIEPLLEHTNSSVRRLAERALAKFSPDYAKKHEVAEQYSSFMPLDTTGPAVIARTPLPPGLIVALRSHTQWYSARVVGTLSNGRVEVQRQGRSDPVVCSRADLRLAPPELDQPNVEAKSLVAVRPNGTRSDGTPPGKDAAKEFRIWADDTGTFAIVAKYVGGDDTHVRLQRKKDGKEIKVPLARLSEADRQTVERLRNSRDNPFDP